jgi:Uma2 family endonuclease
MVFAESFWSNHRMGLPLARMTLAEFLVWEERQPERHEFYRGEVFAMVGGTARHNRVILNLASRIATHLDGSPCQVFAEGMKVQLAEGVVYPDVVVTCGKALAGDEQMIADPKLVIEVLSPSTSGYDKRDKFALYRTLPSLDEYVLIDPATRQVEVFTKAQAGAWLFTDQSRAEAVALSSIGIELSMAIIFKGVEDSAA